MSEEQKMDAYEHMAQRLVPRHQLGPNMTEMQGSVTVDRAVHNSLPPMDDVGEDVTSMQDPKDPDFMSSDVEQLLNARETTHGSFHLNSKYGQMLREMFRGSPGWYLATDRTREILDYYAGKLSRILSGNPEEKQHWEDLAGFARLQYSKKQR